MTSLVVRVRGSYRRLVVPAVSTLLMLVVLVGLGTWQIYRLHWKEGILEQIAMAESGPALPLTQNPVPFAKVSVSGRFLFDHAARFGAEVRDTRAGPTMGYQQIVPLQRDDGPPVLVDRGWVPLDRETPLDQPAGPVTVTGYIRPRETQHWFSPPDDAAAAQFYTLDPSAIGPALGIHNPAPFTLVALGKAASGVYPAPAQTLPRPPNNHLSYVITWYGLAVSLLVIFGIWLRKALRS